MSRTRRASRQSTWQKPPSGLRMTRKYIAVVQRRPLKSMATLLGAAQWTLLNTEAFRFLSILRALLCNNHHLDSQQSRSPVHKEHVRSDTASCTLQVSFGSPYFLDVLCLITIMAETIVYRWIRTMVKPTQGATQNAQIMAMSQGLSGKVQSSTPHNTNSELKNRSSLSVNPPMHN